nr:unnamed protein product [Callosobruchus chinensis]
MNYTVIWRILIDFLHYPYHICNWYPRKLAKNPWFDTKVLFTDKANFSRSAIQNFHNIHLWAKENPMPSQKRTISTNFQLMFGPVLLVIIF